MARVTGIGGIFLRARDPKSLSAWYAKNLGIQLSDYGGATFLSDRRSPRIHRQHHLVPLPRRHQILRLRQRKRPAASHGQLPRR